MKHRDYRSGTLAERKDSGKRFGGTVIKNSYGKVMDGVPNTIEVHIHISGTKRSSTDNRKRTTQGSNVRQRTG